MSDGNLLSLLRSPFCAAGWLRPSPAGTVLSINGGDPNARRALGDRRPPRQGRPNPHRRHSGVSEAGHRCLDFSGRTGAGPAAALHPQGRPDPREVERPSRSASSASAPHDFATPWPSYAAGTAATWSRSSSYSSIQTTEQYRVGSRRFAVAVTMPSGCKVWATRSGGTEGVHLRPGPGGVIITLTCNNRSNIIPIMFLSISPLRNAHGHQS